MREAWELLTAGPPDADRSVLLLPGGANAARSFNLVMAEPALSGVRLVATTLPGMAGAPVSDDVSVPALARRAGELAKEHGCDVVVGFSHGATVALEMVLSGHFQGPVVLLGISLTTEDEAGFFRAVVRASQKVGSWPMAILLRLLPLMARSAKTPEPHKRELIEDLKQNRAGDSVRASGEYLDYIAADRDFAAQLAASGNPVWVVHAEKGDGGLTDAERATLEAAPNVTLVTIPGCGVPPPGRGSAADRRGDRHRPVGGPHMKVRATTTIDKPVSDVFPLMADNRNEPRWNSNLSDSELLTAEPIGVGSRFRAVYQGQECMAVIAEHEPDRVVTFEVDAKRMDITGRMSFSPAGSGTRLDGEFDLRPKGVMKVMLPLVAPLVRRDFPKQFANFKAFAEQR